MFRRFYAKWGGWGYPRNSPSLAVPLAAALLLGGTSGRCTPLTAAQELPGADPDTLTRAAQRSIEQGDTPHAQSLLKEALAASPNHPAANFLLGNLLLGQHRYPEAMDRFETVLAIDLHNPEARAGELAAATSLALQSRAANQPEAALLCLQHARAALPDDPTLLTDLGIQAHSMHLLRPAAEALHAALALTPTAPTPRYALARVELDSEQFEAAEKDFRAYLAEEPADPTAHFGLGHLLAMQQRIPEAKAEFQRSIALEPVQTESYYQLGQIALNAHDDGEARTLFQQTLARSPPHAGALTGLGILAYRSKRYAEARDALTRATHTDPDYQPGHYYLGLALARLGDRSASDAELKIALDLTAKQQGKFLPVPAALLP